MVLLHSQKTLQKGDKAPNFTLENYDGSTVSLSDFTGQAVVVLIMCNHCPYVKAKFDVIKELQSLDIPFLCINSNDPEEYPEDDKEHMRNVAYELGLKYYLVDETQEIAKAYGAVCTPEAYILDKEHKLFYHGRINDAMSPEDSANEESLKDAITALDEGKKIEWFKPSMGCSIKWK
tara:strand:+ start:698 stop:1228 length:531 start_codon:yes stop_codon:yes gene_type:complete